MYKTIELIATLKTQQQKEQHTKVSKKRIVTVGIFD